MHLPLLLVDDLDHRSPGHPSLGESSCPLTIATRRTLRGVVGAPGQMLTAGHASAMTHPSLSPGDPLGDPEKFFRKKSPQDLAAGVRSNFHLTTPAGAQSHSVPRRTRLAPRCRPPEGPVHGADVVALGRRGGGGGWGRGTNFGQRCANGSERWLRWGACRQA